MDVHVTPPYSPIDAERGLPDGQEEEQAHPEVFADEDGRPGYTPGPNKSAPEALRMDSRTTLFPCRLANSKDRRYSRTSLGPAASTHCPTEDDGASRSGLAGLNATLGLIIHAMADGIALGSSSLSSSGGLGLVVFIAVIVHKGVSRK
jgi:zinc transporter ZupT